ncbi:MAG: radical SAM protein [Comamonadaceae bacterium]|nr:radical SAM protein [Comamonadaceae bacterium]
MYRDVDREFFRLARKAGCYQVSFGIESGVPEVLSRVNKHQDPETVRNAVVMAHEEGLETVGFFMLALPGDTVETMKTEPDASRAAFPSPTPRPR